MRYLINYADRAFYQSRVVNSISGIQAGFDAVIQYKREHIDREFFDTNEFILSQPRGAGYWLWKPYFIMKTLKDVSEGDIVFYSDSGARFIRHIQPIFDKLENVDEGIVGFEMSGRHKEKEYTRKSVVKAVMEAENIDVFSETDQRMASFIVARKCDESIKIVQTWLDYCTDPDLILDKPRDNDEFLEFKDHRHDQSLWSLLTKKLNITVLPDPSQWGIENGQTTDVDLFIDHHRKKL